jgi:putative endonuclease
VYQPAEALEPRSRRSFDDPGATVAPTLLEPSGMLGTARQTIGKAGEDLACAELRRRGYAILARRYRSRRGEIDIVARDGDTLVFVEVKARRGASFGAARDAVTWRKRRRLQVVAGDFLARSRLSAVPCRFDVVAVTVSPGGRGPAVEVYPGAFGLGE